MLLVTKIDNEEVVNLQTEFKNKVFSISVNPGDMDSMIKTIEQIKSYTLQYDLLFINKEPYVLACLDKLHITYYITDDVVVSEDSFDSSKILYLNNNSLRDILSNYFPWITTTKSLTTSSKPTSGGLTLQKLSETDVNITEADVRQTKLIETKAKVAMYLQVDMHIKRLYKLLNAINLLEDELLNRVSTDIQTADTGSLIQVSKCLNDTLTSINSLIMNIVNNEKIQNFFVIDNSKNVNIEAGVMDVESRDKLRKAMEIITQNLDLFKQGKIDSLVDPNSVIEVKQDDSKT